MINYNLHIASALAHGVLKTPSTFELILIYEGGKRSAKKRCGGRA